jgi:hypothetical protein
MFGLVARVYGDQGTGKSVYFIQTFEHSNIQTFLTSYLPLPLFSTSPTATPALTPHSHNSSAQKTGNGERGMGSVYKTASIEQIDSALLPLTSSQNIRREAKLADNTF